MKRLEKMIKLVFSDESEGEFSEEEQQFILMKEKSKRRDLFTEV